MLRFHQPLSDSQAQPAPFSLAIRPPTRAIGLVKALEQVWDVLGAIPLPVSAMPICT